MINIGLVYPQTEFGDDPAAIRDYAQSAEELGYTHILAYDHVLSSNPDRPGGWHGPYTHEHPFQEPLTLYSFMAGVTQKLEFATGIIILPQRQTALFAKQAATLDLLSNGRLRVGIGLGWNDVEYIALNENFNNRGRRIEEQVAVLRMLWTQPLVTYQGRWHRLLDTGLNPLPLQRPIPIWFGGHAEQVLHRTARLGDGWMPGYRQAAEAQPALDTIYRTMELAGRNPAELGIEPRLHYGDGDPDVWAKTIQGWDAVGATHISFNSMGKGFDTPDKHMKVIRDFATNFCTPQV